MSAPAVTRQPAGTPIGGQFAATARTEPDVHLDEDEDDDLEVCSSCGGDLSDNEGYDGLCGTCADAAEPDEDDEDQT